jgi:hypothetical protein
MYRQAEIVVERADSQAPIVHPLPPPSVQTLNFTSIYDKEFMKQVILKILYPE